MKIRLDFCLGVCELFDSILTLESDIATITVFLRVAQASLSEEM